MTDTKPALSEPPPISGVTDVSIETTSGPRNDAWDDFVRSSPDGSFYHMYAWKRINEEQLGHSCLYLEARQPDGAIAGILPLVFVQSRIFGRILCSVPFMNFGGPVASDPFVSRMLAERAVAEADSLDADYLELRCSAALDLGMPVSLRKISLRVTLEADPHALHARFSRKHRKNIRSAQRNNLDVSIGGVGLLDEFYRVLEQSWRNLGTPLYSIAYFRRILEAFPDDTTVYVCRAGSLPVSVALTGHSNGIVEGMWAGAVPEARRLDANYVLYWEMLRDACEKGHTSFHLGRSTADSGAEQFKSKWTAEAHQLYWYFHRPRGGPMPALNVDNPRYRLAIAAWRRLPLWATRILGPPIARLIP